MSDRIMIYGATGYTGKLMARMAKQRGMSPVLAGRSADKVTAIATEMGFEARVFPLDDPAIIAGQLHDIGVVLHIAGPFSATSKPMVEACIQSKTHYLDITGEIDVFEGCAARDADALKAGVMVLPGVGFDVVPSDCLAAFTAARQPDATALKIFISGLGEASQGTMKTAVESLGSATRARRNNQIVDLPDTPTAQCDFGEGPRDCVAISWGDVSTAWHSTHVPDIEVYFEAVGPMKQMGSMGPVMKFIMRQGFVKRLLKKQIERGPAGPDDEARAKGRSILVAEAEGPSGTSTARLRTPEGYTLTYLTGLEIAARAAAGDFKPGFQTPSRAYGADFITEIDGCTREIVNAR